MLIAILILIILILLAVSFGLTDLHLHKKAKDGDVKVACVGDSITYGCMAPLCFVNSYPSVLSRLLGKGYHVENFGLNDRGVQNSYKKPYVVEKEFTNSLEYKPDIVLLMLGTNDTKAQCELGQDFIDDYVKIINEYKTLDSHPRIIIGIPLWGKDADGFFSKYSNDCITEKLSDIVKLVEVVSKECDLETVDFYTMFEDHLDLLSHDHLHPNKKGYQLIAESFCDKIKSSNM